MSLYLIHYQTVTVLDGLEPEARTQPTPILGDLLAKPGESENDTVVRIDLDNVIPLYKWSTERNAWQMVN